MVFSQLLWKALQNDVILPDHIMIYILEGSNSLFAVKIRGLKEVFRAKAPPRFSRLNSLTLVHDRPKIGVLNQLGGDIRRMENYGVYR